MSSDPDYVISVIHHDSETKMYVTGFPNPGSYIHEINYAATVAQIVAMKVRLCFYFSYAYFVVYLEMKLCRMNTIVCSIKITNINNA